MSSLPKFQASSSFLKDSFWTPHRRRAKVEGEASAPIISGTATSTMLMYTWYGLCEVGSGFVEFASLGDFRVSLDFNCVWVMAEDSVVGGVEVDRG
ncbi:hypothetical protein Ancab_000867 [Ancistrocladus abbreviatus]